MLSACFIRRVNIRNVTTRQYWFSNVLSFPNGAVGWQQGDKSLKRSFSCRSPKPIVASRDTIPLNYKRALFQPPSVVDSELLRPNCLPKTCIRTIILSSHPRVPRWRRNKRRERTEQHDVQAALQMKDKVDEKMSVAAEMLCRSIEASEVNEDEQNNSREVEKSQVEASFAELEKLASVKIKEAYPFIDELSEDEEGFVENHEELSKHSEKSDFQTSMVTPRSGKKVEFYGTPDPTVPVSNVPCHGCGALLHCQDPGIAGYLPSQKFVATLESQLKDITCQRCRLLKAYNIAIDVSVGPSDYEPVVKEVKQQTAMLVLIVDLTDLPNSFHKAIASLSDKRRPLYLVGNKVDLLPKDDDGYLKRIKASLLQLCRDQGISPEEDVKHVALISAKTGYGVEDLITRLLRDWAQRGQVYLLGCTNAGKSTLFNALLSSDFCRSSARELIQRATTSIWPGTTMNLLKFPIVNPKPAVLFRRIQRLQEQKTKNFEEEKLRQIAFKNSGDWRHVTLMGHIGTSISTPKQVGIEESLSKHSSFVVPTYSFSNIEPDNLKQYSGEGGLVEVLKPHVPEYDESKFKYWCFDTPGLINPDQIINLLNPQELQIVLPKKLLKPRTFSVRPTQVMFVSGLGRIDYSQGDERVIYLTVFASDRVPVHVVSKDEADEFYSTNVGTSVLEVPIGDSERLQKLPPLTGKEFTVEGRGWKESSADIVLSSLGWVAITVDLGKSVSLTAYTPEGRGCTLRTPPLLAYAINQRGKRIRGTAGYGTRRHKM